MKIVSVIRRVGARRSKAGKGGYYTVEAAVFLPIFIIACLTIGYLIKVIGGVESGMHACVDECRYQAAVAYKERSGLGLKGRIENRIHDENRYITRAKVKHLSYLTDDGAISMDIDYHLDIPLPMDLYSGFHVTDSLKCRGWIGKTYDDPFTFEAMEKDEEATIVYIFPAWGSKYHKKECTFVTAHPVQTILTPQLKRQYKGCPLCRSGTLPAGSVVYCFPKYGDSYHRGDCNTIDKYTITIELEQAEERGYTPCSKCGGK